MGTGRAERERESSLGAAARKRAFAVAVALIAAAGALIVLLGPSSEGGEGRAGDPGRERTVLTPAGANSESSVAPELDEGDLRAARAAARRFALAYLARESGRMDGVVRRVLRRISVPALWQVLRQPPRATPVWQPPLARFGELSGITETPIAGVVDVVVAYRVKQRRRYLTVRLSREGGRWRALPHGL